MKKILKTTLLLLFATSLFSCEKFNDEEAFEDKDANSTLVIRTRAAQAEGAEGTAEISYPVNIYVFDEADRCVDLVQLASGDDELSLKLPEGSYGVYALAGTDAEAYELPTKENATKDAVVALKDGHMHGDVMTAKNNVKMAYGEENTLTLSLERKVMMLESVIINNVPASVTAVTVSVSPLYENIKLDGTYDGDNGDYTANLTREGETNVWKSAGAVYLLEASGTATVKVSFTTGDNIHSYSYNCPKELKANYKVNINGTYSSDGVELSGSITGVEWAGTTDVTFSFDESGESETVVPGGDDDPSGEDAVTGETIEVGGMYKGCYVLMKNDEEKTVTLMSPKYKTSLNFNEGDQESLKTAVDAGIAELAVDGIDGWRLANMDEINDMKQRINDIKEDLDSLLDKGKVQYFNLAAMYYCQTDDGIFAYNLTNIDSKPETPESGSSSYILRAFATINYPE